MTEMRRVTISLPDEIDKKVLKLRQDERFTRCTYSEVVRRALARGLEELDDMQRGATEVSQDSA